MLVGCPAGRKKIKSAGTEVCPGVTTSLQRPKASHGEEQHKETCRSDYSDVDMALSRRREEDNLLCIISPVCRRKALCVLDV